VTRKRRLLMALGFLAITLIARGAVPESPSAAALGWLKALNGTWQGRAEWSGGRTGSYAMTATYRISGNGTVVVEDLESDGVTTMTSVYPQDGSDLRMTHFCGAGNQPRLKAAEIDTAKRTVRFEMVDMTGRPGGHVGGVELRIPDADHATILFTFVGGKASAVERLDLTRTVR
jgi:hypothetical protein